MLISHWCKLIEGLQTSPLDFYKCIEDAIDRRQIPGLKRKHVLWPEGGMLSANRDYLRLSREKLLFDVCAAPFGTGFFVSSRLVDKEFPWLRLMLLLAAPFILVQLVVFYVIGAEKGSQVLLVCILWSLPSNFFLFILLWLLQRFLRHCLLRLDELFLSMPWIGSLYSRFIHRNTYYRIDLILMFQSAVQAAVLEVVDKHLETQGLKPLSELERKPTLSALLMR